MSVESAISNQLYFIPWPAVETPRPSLPGKMGKVLVVNVLTMLKDAFISSVLVELRIGVG
jgi:hypothetical protein